MWGYTYAKSYFFPERVPLWESYKVRAVSMGDQHVLALVNMKALSQREATVGVIAWGKSSSGALGIGVGGRA